MKYYLDTLDKVQRDLIELKEKNHLSEEQYKDLLEKLQQTRDAFKESENKGVFFFAMWTDWLNCQLTLTQVQKE